MVVISQAIETVIALIIFIFIVLLFFSIFGSSECDKLSNSTAIELVNTINKVALGDGVASWDKDSVPSDEDTNYYAYVPIRLCEKNQIITALDQFTARQPTYILTYETFPEAGYAWSESQPFSGGASESVMNYLFMKYGTKAFMLGTKYAVRIVKGIAKGVWTLVWGGGKAVLGAKLSNWLDKVKNNRVIKWILRRFGSSAAEKTVEETVEDKLVKTAPDKFKDAANRVRDLQKIEGSVFQNSMAEAGFFEGVLDASTNKIEPLTQVIDGKEKWIVKPEYRDFVLLYLENMGDDAEALRDSIYIPAKYSFIENFKIQKWYPLKYSFQNMWKNSWFKRNLIDKPKEIYNKIKGGFNKVFNYKEGMMTEYDTPQESGIIKNYLLFHRDELRQNVMDNFDNYKGPLEEITGKVFDSADDVADADLIKLVNKYDRYFNSNLLVQYVSRDQQDLTSVASKALGREIKDNAEKVASAANPSAEYNNFMSSIVNPWDNLPPLQQQAWIDKFSSGYTTKIDPERAGEVYEYARASAIRKGILDRTQVVVGGSVKTNWLVKQADDIKGDMIAASRFKFSKYSVEKIATTDYYLSPILAESGLSAFQVSTALWQRAKREVFLDLNRVGQGPIAPYNIFASPYSLNEALERESEIQEGGCAPQSICKLQRGQAAGPTESATAYLLDRKVSPAITVKLWRPKPDWTARTPVGLNSALFYNSITPNPRFYVASPCFGIAKVWKNGDTVFINIEKGRKCDTSNCSQPRVNWVDVYIPFTNTKIVSVPQTNFGIDTPNYCYASEEYIWGQDLTKWGTDAMINTGDAPSEIYYYTGFGVCTAVCTAASQGAGFKACLKGCGYGTIAALFVHTTATTQIYRDVPSYRRQETGWGYWNFQKAQDICDNIQMIASFGTFQGGLGAKFSQAHKTISKLGEPITKVGNTVSKVGKYTGIGIGDLCYGITLIGDTSLGWPIKTPVAEVWRKAGTLDEDCMQDIAAECVWIEKCVTNADCPDGMYCDPGSNTCKKL